MGGNRRHRFKGSRLPNSSSSSTAAYSASSSDPVHVPSPNSHEVSVGGHQQPIASTTKRSSGHQKAPQEWRRKSVQNSTVANPEVATTSVALSPSHKNSGQLTKESVESEFNFGTFDSGVHSYVGVEPNGVPSESVVAPLPSTERPVINKSKHMKKRNNLDEFRVNEYLSTLSIAALLWFHLSGIFKCFRKMAVSVCKTVLFFGDKSDGSDVIAQKYEDNNRGTHLFGWERGKDHCRSKTLREFIEDPLNEKNAASGIQILKGILKGLDELFHADLFHGNLTSDNVIIISTHKGLFVQLKNYETQSHSSVVINTSLQEDLTALGVILKEWPTWGEKSSEVEDLIRRIDMEQWPSDTVPVEPKHRERLQNRLRLTYATGPAKLLGLPPFWSEDRDLDFIRIAYEILATYDVVDPVPHVSSFYDFQVALNSLNVDPWDKDFAAELIVNPDWDKSSSISVTRYFRNVHCHFFKYDKEDCKPGNEIRKTDKEIGETNCCAYFKNKHPELLIHLYRCFETYYPYFKHKMHTSSQKIIKKFIPTLTVEPPELD